MSVIYQTGYSLRDQIISAYRGASECQNLSFIDQTERSLRNQPIDTYEDSKPTDTYEDVCAQLRSSTNTAIQTHKSQQQLFNARSSNDNDDTDDYQYGKSWIGRIYNGRDRYRGGSRDRGRFKKSRKKLRKKGRIIISDLPFEASDKQKIDNLINKEIFRFEQYNPIKHIDIRIFKSRLIREIKSKTTEAPYEKSRLVIQGYQDDGKEMILIQSPIIQRTGR